MLHLLILIGVYQLFGMGGVKYQMVQVFLGLFWDEMVNYVEHYGLRRTKDKDGIFESIGYMHSWSALSSPVGFRIQRHSDHHAHKFRPYQILRKFDRAPTMPLEYILLLFCALCPPVWFYLMDPVVKSINDAKEGIKNEDKWNLEMSYSEADLVRLRNVKMYIALVSVFFTLTIFV